MRKKVDNSTVRQWCRTRASACLSLYLFIPIGVGVADFDPLGPPTGDPRVAPGAMAPSPQSPHQKKVIYREITHSGGMTL